MPRPSAGWLLCLCLWLPSMATADVVRLEDLEAQALKQRPSLEAARARLHQAEAHIASARAAYYPSFGLVGDATLAPGLVIREIQPGVFVQTLPPIGEPNAFALQPRYGLGLQAQGTLYDFGRTGAAVEAAEAQQGAAQAEVEVSRTRIIRAVRGAYVAWLANYELANIADATARNASERRGQVEALIEEGVRPPAERATAQADEMLAQLEAARARGERDNALRTLEQAVGARIMPDAAPDMEMLTLEMPRSATSAVTEVEDDPVLTALARQQDAAQATAKLYARGRRPVLTGNAIAGIRGQQQFLFPGFQVGIGLALPLWDGGANSANTELARAQARELAAQIMEQRQANRQAIRQAQAEQSQAEARLEIAQQLQGVAAQRLENAELQYRLGAGLLEQVADARAMVQRAQREVMLAQAARLDAILRWQPL